MLNMAKAVQSERYAPPHREIPDVFVDSRPAAPPFRLPHQDTDPAALRPAS